MAAKTSKEKQLVLVTGASGFIAKHCILKLLREGYAVRGSLRTPSRADEVRTALKHHVAIDDLSFVTLDLSDDAGWDEAMMGCSYVMHVASPFPSGVPDHEDDLIIPAKEGALRALRAATKAGVKRVVLTSSMAAIAYGHEDAENKVVNEDDWSVLEGISAYPKSKTIAERTAWDFIGSDAAGGMELAVINPGAVLGPLLDAGYSTSGELVKKLINREAPACPRLGFAVIDVRDVAEAHYQAMIRPEAAGQRFFCVHEFAWMQDVSKALHAAGYNTPLKRLPDFMVSILAMFDKTIALIKTDIGQQTKIDNTRLRTVLGITPISMPDMSIAMANSMVEYGVVKVKKRAGF